MLTPSPDRLNNDAFNDRALIAQDLNRCMAIPIYFPEPAESAPGPGDVDNYTVSLAVDTWCRSMPARATRQVPPARAAGSPPPQSTLD
jgi:hypothetical protein